MHELTLCMSLLASIQAHSHKNKVNQIKKIMLEVGELAGVELEALTFAFPIAARGSIAENAILEITRVQGKAWCQRCKINVIIQTLFEPCSFCGQYDYTITQGKELRIKRMEVI